MSHDNLWAPWRMEYIRQLENRGDHDQAAPSSCFLCEAAATTLDSQDAPRRLVLLNDDRGMILLNLYPYTNGHLLVAPQRHTGDLTDLSEAERHHLMDLTVLAEKILHVAVNPQGLNVGVNLGKCAGAGLPGHVHVHVLPRWNGDTNFMQSVGRVRVVPQALEESYNDLATALKKIVEHEG